jgi:predicted dehydrogenase
MERKLGWGILATGWIAELFTADIIKAGMTVSAVGSRSLDKADAFASRFGIATAHGSYQALVDDPGVDIVYIATPHSHHRSAALLAIEAGKNVLVEKPFALNAIEARDIVQRANEKRVVVLEAMWTRFLPHMARIRQVIASGLIGDVTSVAADHRQFLPTDPSHRLNAPELGGGALLDLGIYPISFACDILGMPISVSANARFGRTGVDTEIATLMTHENGALSSSVSALDINMPNKAHIFGSKGRIEIDSTWYAPTSFRVIDNKGQVIEDFTSEVAGRGMQFQAIEMERLVVSGESSSLMPPEQTVGIMTVLDAIRQKIGLVYPNETAGA